MKIKDWILPTAATSLILLNACGGDEEKSADEIDDGNDLLIGDWKVISIDGESVLEVGEGYEYFTLFKFKAEGDFNLCFVGVNDQDPDSNYEQCQEGSWEWVVADESFDFSFTQIADNEEFLSEGNAQITLLEGDDMEATIERTLSSGGTSTLDYAFEKQ